MKRLLLIPALLALHPAYLYATADVSCLATACVYTPPGKEYQRLAGLNVSPEVPQVVQAAMQIGELRDYQTAWPVQPQKIALAVFDSLKTGKRIGNTSGLEQQIAKNVFVGSERTLWRKYREAVYAVKLYRSYSKPELMRVYASLAQTGPNTYGFFEAAETYFNKPAKELKPAEALLILQSLPEPEVRFVKYSRPLCPGLWAWMFRALSEQGYDIIPAVVELQTLDNALTNQQKGKL